MKKSEVVSFLKRSIRSFSIKTALHPSDGDGNIKRAVSIIILKDFLKFVEKEEDFVLRTKNKSFTESFLEAVDILSTKNAYKTIDRTKSDESTGLDILREAIENYKEEKKGDKDEAK
jgi:hypothetical protein